MTFAPKLWAIHVVSAAATASLITHAWTTKRSSSSPRDRSGHRGGRKFDQRRPVTERVRTRRSRAPTTGSPLSARGDDGQTKRGCRLMRTTKRRSSFPRGRGGNPGLYYSKHFETA